MEPTSIAAWLAVVFAGIAAGSQIKAGVVSASGRLRFVRRRRATRTVHRLRVGRSIDEFTRLLGDGFYPIDDQIRAWVSDVFMVQAVFDGAGKVVAWSVTTRDERWKPRFGIPTAYGNRRDFTLGQSTFSELEPSGVIATAGARRFWYGERVSRGNPGSYQEFVLGVNDAGAFRDTTIALSAAALIETSLGMPLVPERSTTVANTFTEVYQFAEVTAELLLVGADLDAVRHLF